MVDKALFTQLISLLTENFPRDREKLSSEAVLAIWYEYFNEELTNEEFAQSVRYVVLHHDFLPAPCKFVEHVHGTKEGQALQEWRLIVEASGKPHGMAQLAYLSRRGQVALHAIGGLHKLGLAEHYQRDRMEKSFITVYCQCSKRDSHALPQTSSVAPVEAEEVDQVPVPMPDHIREQFEQLTAKFAMNGKGKD